MLLAMDGFDHYAAKTETAANIAAYLTAAGYSVANAGNATFQLADGQEPGSLNIKLNVVAASGTPPSFSRAFATVADLVVFGFSYRGTGSRTRIARINSAVDLLWDAASGKLRIGAVEGVDVIILNAYWYIEIEIDKANNQVRVWANDTLQITAALPAGAVTTNHTILWGLTGASTEAATQEVDDFYCVDSSGGTNITRLGPTQMITRAPTTDVTTEWTPVGSTGTHASILAQLSPNAPNAPYLQANVEAKRDRVTSNTVLPNDNQIFGVSVVAYSRKGDLDNRALGVTVLTPGGETEVAIPLTTSFAYRTAIYEKAPGNVNWDQSLVEASQFGIVAR